MNTAQAAAIDPPDCGAGVAAIELLLALGITPYGVACDVPNYVG